jgi:hypothetical protein
MGKSETVEGQKSFHKSGVPTGYLGKIKNQLDATHMRFIRCSLAQHVSSKQIGPSKQIEYAHHQEYNIVTTAY